MPTPITEASLKQNRALASIPKFSSFLSFVSSCYIVYDIYRLRFNKKKRKPVGSGRHGSTLDVRSSVGSKHGSGSVSMYHRIMLGMSVCDMFASGAWFFTTWPIPKDVFPAYGASGTVTTCTAQGFFAQFSIAIVFYNGFLCLYYLLVIKYNWSEQKIANHKIEYVMHAVSLAMGVGTATFCVYWGLFNPIGWDCWISAVPIGCKESWLNDGETTCTRGDNANLYQWCFFYIPLWIVIFFVTVAMTLVCTTFRKTQKKANKWRFSMQVSQQATGRGGELGGRASAASGTSTGAAAAAAIGTICEGSLEEESGGSVSTSSRGRLRGSAAGQKVRNYFTSVRQFRGSRASRASRASRDGDSKTKLVTSQSILYAGSFYFVWLFPTLLRIHEVTSEVVYYYWVVLSATFVPIQGFLNVIIYLRPKFLQKQQLKLQKKKREKQRKLQQEIQQKYKMEQQQQLDDTKNTASAAKGSANAPHPTFVDDDNNNAVLVPPATTRLSDITTASALLTTAGDSSRSFANNAIEQQQQKQQQQEQQHQQEQVQQQQQQQKQEKQQLEDGGNNFHPPPPPAPVFATPTNTATNPVTEAMFSSSDSLHENVVAPTSPTSKPPSPNRSTELNASDRSSPISRIPRPTAQKRPNSLRRSTRSSISASMRSLRVLAHDIIEVVLEGEDGINMTMQAPEFHEEDEEDAEGEEEDILEKYMLEKMKMEKEKEKKRNKKDKNNRKGSNNDYNDSINEKEDQKEEEV